MVEIPASYCADGVESVTHGDLPNQLRVRIGHFRADWPSHRQLWGTCTVEIDPQLLKTRGLWPAAGVLPLVQVATAVLVR